jgi:hypothetical protein
MWTYMNLFILSDLRLLYVNLDTVRIPYVNLRECREVILGLV